MSPLVSVILCTYNQAEYLDQAIRSVLDQTYPEVELIVVDNGSRDGSGAVLDRYAGLPHVALIRHGSNDAVTRRLNDAIKRARGQFLSLLYGDDFYLTDKISRQIESFRDDGELGVVYGPGVRLNVRNGERWIDHGPTRSGWIAEDLLKGIVSGGVNPIAPLIRRDCLERYPFYEDLFIEGESIFLRIALSFRFLFRSEPLVVMREHPLNRGKAYRLNTENTLVILDRLARHPDLPDTLKPALADVRARLMRNFGWQLVRVLGDRAGARRAFAQAARWHWSQAVHPRTLVGTILTLCPPPLLAMLNRLGSALSRQKAGVEFRDDYS